MLHDGELCDLYRTVGVVRVVKCGRVRWAGNVATTHLVCLQDLQNRKTNVLDIVHLEVNDRQQKSKH